MDYDEEQGEGVLVSQMELSNIRRIFNRFDADGSGTIDVAELKDVMASLGVLMDGHHLKELVAQVSSDGSDELNFDEFVSLITLWKEASQYKLFDGKGFKSLAQQHVEEALEAKSYLPDEPWRAAWDVTITLAALTMWVGVLLLDAYSFRMFNSTGLIIGDVILTLIYVADIIISGRTAYRYDVRLIDEPRQVFLHYARTWLVPDVLAAIPFDLILTLSGASMAANVLRHVRLLKTVKLPFIWGGSGSVPITSRYIQFHFHLLPIFQLVLTFIFMVHGFSTGWILLKQTDCAYEDLDCKYSYTTAVYFVIYTLSTVGLGDVEVNGESEQWYASFVLCGAMATNGIVIGKLVAILQRADINKERRAKLRETLAVLEHFSIPRQLQEEILQFQAHVLEHNLGAAYEGIVDGLPDKMRKNISLFVKMKLVTNVPLFSDTHYMLRIAVAQSLEQSVARPEQYVIVHGQPTEALYFLAYGFADVFLANGVYDGTLRSGDYFGDGALLGETTQPISVKAITYCDMWKLRESVFTKIATRFPKFNRYVDTLRRHTAEVEASRSSIGNPLLSPNLQEIVAAAGGVQRLSRHSQDRSPKNSNHTGVDMTEFASAGPPDGAESNRSSIAERRRPTASPSPQPSPAEQMQSAHAVAVVPTPALNPLTPQEGDVAPRAAAMHLDEGEDVHSEQSSRSSSTAVAATAGKDAIYEGDNPFGGKRRERAVAAPFGSGRFAGIVPRSGTGGGSRHAFDEASSVGSFNNNTANNSHRSSRVVLAPTAAGGSGRAGADSGSNSPALFPSLSTSNTPHMTGLPLRGYGGLARIGTGSKSLFAGAAAHVASPAGGGHHHPPMPHSPTNRQRIARLRDLLQQARATKQHLVLRSLTAQPRSAFKGGVDTVE